MKKKTTARRPPDGQRQRDTQGTTMHGGTCVIRHWGLCGTVIQLTHSAVYLVWCPVPCIKYSTAPQEHEWLSSVPAKWSEIRFGALR